MITTAQYKAHYTYITLALLHKICVLNANRKYQTQIEF